MHACPDGFGPITNVYSCQTAATVYNYEFDDTSDVGVCQLCTSKTFKMIDETMFILFLIVYLGPSINHVTLGGGVVLVFQKA